MSCTHQYLSIIFYFISILYWLQRWLHCCKYEHQFFHRKYKCIVCFLFCTDRTSMQWGFAVDGIWVVLLWRTFSDQSLPYTRCPPHPLQFNDLSKSLASRSMTASYSDASGRAAASLFVNSVMSTFLHCLSRSYAHHHHIRFGTPGLLLCDGINFIPTVNNIFTQYF